MSKHSASQCSNGIELLDYATKHGASLERQSGSHAIVRLPNGEYESIPQHRHELHKGLKCKIVKHLAAAGIMLLVIVPVISKFIGG